MCQYSYYIYDLCSHRSIEVTNYCAIAFHLAGRIGWLRPCQPEESYYYAFVEPQYPELPPRPRQREKLEDQWRSMSGFCKKCEEDFEMEKTFHYPTHNDIKFVDEISPPGVTQYTLPVPPPLPLSSSSRSFLGSRNDTTHETPSRPSSTVRPNALLDYDYSARRPSVPHPILNLSILSPSSMPLQYPNLPYIYTPPVSRRIHQLLGWSDQVPMDARDKPWFPVIHFPSRFAPYKNSTSQFWSAAHIDGKLCKPDPNTFWARNIGLSVEDAKVINIALGRRMSIGDLWSLRFKDRGMDFRIFSEYASKLLMFQGGMETDKLERLPPYPANLVKPS